ncbi:MAG: aromatic amino acid lyase [Bacteroidetes bacterium]|nr:aromatic amino acid lyase [Bacteroidota bacterium]HET6244601.1 aromatic amino acid ammonia-lyase [Bacteroidia bacterium]
MISIGEQQLTISDIYAILFEEQKIKLSEKALKKVNESYLFLNEFSKGKLIYGINTGFGPMAQYKIADKDLRQLQYNLIRSHCSGSGNLLSDDDLKSTMIVRLVSLMRGYSGVNKELVELLRELINKGILPCIYEHGGVGASGDLVQLAHLALTLIGEGEVVYNGKVSDAASVYKKEKLKPLTIHKREGIAVLNGTSAMSGIGAINLIYARKLLNWSVAFSTIINEIVEAFDDHFSTELNGVKHHVGQQKVAAAMRKIVGKSKLIKKRSDTLYQSKNIEQQDIVKEKVQEYYSLRCVPQILGPVYDSIVYAEQVVMNEVNSVNDNPIIDCENQDVFHGGNFHGDYVALEMDKLKIAVTKLAMLSERQLNYLLNDKLNQKLPPFLNLGKLGLNYGIQGMQFTATSTTAECQTLSMPAYIHSIPNNNDNQDVVSMGTNAALITRKVIENTFEVLSIHAIAVVQAVDGLECSNRLSPFSKKIYNEIRKICPVILEDRPMYKDIKKVREYLKKEKINIV